MMKISPAGLELIKAHEGLRLKAYKCPAGVWTIGYGSTGPHVRPGLVITDKEAVDLLIRDVARFEAAVNRLVKVPLNQNQFDALVSFVFNVGVGAFEKSTLLRLLNGGRYEAVPAQLMRWTKAKGRELPGLVKRRRDEGTLWATPIAETPVKAVSEAPSPPNEPFNWHGLLLALRSLLSPNKDT